MSLKRKRSYIIIEIKDPMISSEQILKNAIAKINKNQTIIDFIFSACYYYFIDRIVSFFYFFIYYRSFTIRNVKINGKIINLMKIFIFDNSINILGISVPYENIIEFGRDKKKIYLNIFTKTKNDFFTKSIISFETDLNVEYIFKIIKANMFYHIKYHKINTNDIEYYKLA